MQARHVHHRPGIVSETRREPSRNILTPCRSTFCYADDGIRVLYVTGVETRARHITEDTTGRPRHSQDTTHRPRPPGTQLRPWRVDVELRAAAHSRASW